MMASKRFEFRTNDETLKNYLEKQISVSKSIEEILVKFVKGEIVTKRQQDLIDVKIRRQKAMAIRSEVLAKIDMVHKLKLESQQVINIIENRLNVLDLHIETKEVLQSDGRLRCMDCGKLFAKTDPPFAMIGSLQKHLRDEHDRSQNNVEQKILLQLSGQ